MSITQRLKEIRYRLGMSQGQIAKALNITSQAFSKYESRDNAPPPSVGVKLRQQFGIDLNWLYTGIGEIGLVDKGSIPHYLIELKDDPGLVSADFSNLPIMAFPGFRNAPWTSFKVSYDEQLPDMLKGDFIIGRQVIISNFPFGIAGIILDTLGRFHIGRLRMIVEGKVLSITSLFKEDSTKRIEMEDVTMVWTVETILTKRMRRIENHPYVKPSLPQSQSDNIITEVFNQLKEIKAHFKIGEPE